MMPAAYIYECEACHKQERVPVPRAHYGYGAPAPEPPRGWLYVALQVYGGMQLTYKSVCSEYCARMAFAALLDGLSVPLR